ncbi:MAG: hypothetical protein JWM98_2266 [Thermoleophilia bacterium]|nr:hypothetical protein [Thermoleophilia bacterium]
MRALLVRNEGSGSARDADPEAVLVEHGFAVTTVDVETAVALGSGDDAATRHPGIDRVVVAGGDGSIGCAARVAVRLGVPLGVVPAGTANDFARAVDLPDDLDAACTLAATGARTREVDLGDLDGRPFVNVASMGLSPAAAEHAERLKGGLRSLAYPVGAILAAARARPISVVVSVDGAPAWSGRALQVIIANSGSFGGWADIDHAHEDDRQLDVVVVPAGRDRRKLVFDAASLHSGELARREGVHHFRSARFEIELRRPPRIVIDGELVELRQRRIVASVDPRPLRLVVE